MKLLSMCQVSAMDSWFITVSALLLFSLDPVQNNTSPNSTTSPASSTRPPRSPFVPVSSALRLGLLTVEWGPGCRGSVFLTQPERTSRRHVCYDSRSAVRPVLSGLCEGRPGCRGDEVLERSGGNKSGLMISERNLKEANCSVLTVRCEAEVLLRPTGHAPCVQCPVCVEQRPPEEPQEPVGFRVATAVLSVVLVLLLLLCFSKPTVKALQKRLSNKRKNRWVGPTQSHSVSYHRGQTVNTEGQKHSSYPALDRLVLGNREPSSNRNSYNF